jgi:hypothetical protein
LPSTASLLCHHDRVPAYRTPGQNRVVALVEFLILAVSLAVALILSPLADWSVLDILLAGLLAIIAIYSLYLLVTGKSDGGSSERGFANPQLRRTFALVAVGLFALLIVFTILANGGEPWTANDVLLLGVWTYLVVAMISNFTIANAQMRRAA